MTPREKAKELVDRYKESTLNDIFYEWNYVHKRNALIVANEAIDILEILYSSIINEKELIIDEKVLFKIKWEKIWWKDVRKEIEKIIKEIEK